MRIQNTLSKYYLNYEKSKQNQIENYISSGGNILDIFEDIKEKFDINIYYFEWSRIEDSKDKELDLRLFKLYALMTKPKNLIENSYDNWIKEVLKEDPELFTYLYVTLNFRFNVVSGIRNYEQVSTTGRWYLNDYDKYKENIEKLLNKTRDESLKAQIQACRYINEKDQDSLKYLNENINNYISIMIKTQSKYIHIELIEDKKILEELKSKKDIKDINARDNDVFAMIVYYLYKTQIIDNNIYAQTSFIIAHDQIMEMDTIIKQDKSLYIDEYRYMNSKFELSKLALKIFATNIIGKRYFNIKDYLEQDQYIFVKDESQKLIKYIHDLQKNEDILNSIVLYSILINQLEESNKKEYLNDIDYKIKNLIIEFSEKANNKENIVNDIENKMENYDLGTYESFLSKIRYKRLIDTASIMMFGQSNIATNYIVVNMKYTKDFYLIENYMDFKIGNKNKIQDLIDRGIEEENIINKLENSYWLKGEIKKSYFEYLDLDLNRYKDRMYKTSEESIYETLFNHYYYEKKVEDIEIAISGLKNRYKKIQNLSRDYFKGKPQYNKLLEEVSKEKLPKDNKDMIEYIIDYNKLQTMDIENIDLDKILEEFYNPKKMDKVIKKLDITKLPDVRYIDQDELVSQELLRYYLGSFLLSPKVELPLTSNLIKSRLNKSDLNDLGRYVYEKWYSLGAQANMKMAMVFAVYNCDESFIVNFKKQLDTWTENSRGAIASEGVKAMAFHGSDYALMQLDSISRKYKNKQVKNTASEYFLIAAKNMGLTKEELADLVIPNLGFDSNKELELDYGPRKFKCRLDKNLNISIQNEDKKTIKSLPAPSKSDDENMAKASKKQLSDIKKQLKTIVSSQKLRLERAIFIERRWDMETFKKVFVQNPIMNMFAVNLIWGKYDSQNKLVNSFRYMDDGTFADSDYEDIELQAQDTIGLIHPMDLTKDELEIWKENLDDNNITQPIEQLDIKVIEIEQEKLSGTIYDKFYGKKIPAISLVSKLEKYGWYKTSIIDGGGFVGLYLEFEELSYGAQINADHLYIGIGDEEVTIKDLLFYPKDKIKRGSYMYDDVDMKDTVKLKDLDPKFLNAVISQLLEIIGE